MIELRRDAWEFLLGESGAFAGRGQVGAGAPATRDERDVRTIVEREEWSVFEPLPPTFPEAAQLLREICQELERRNPSIHDERAMSLGVALGLRHVALESVALDWMEASSGATRLLITSALLSGLWARFTPSDVPFHREGLRRLRRCRGDRVPSAAAEACYVLAIDRARTTGFLDDVEAADVEAELVAIAERPLDGSEASRGLQALIVELLTS